MANRLLQKALRIGLSSLALFSSTLTCYSGANGDELSRGILKPTSWMDYEIHSMLNTHSNNAIIDINDQFIVKTNSDGDEIVVSIGVLDGLRRKFGTCESGRGPKLGERMTTWTTIKYGKVDRSGRRLITLTRTADFYLHENSYSFSVGNNYIEAVLDSEASIHVSARSITYRQAGEHIGTSGNIKKLSINYNFSDRYDAISAKVALNDSMWDIASTNTILYHPTYTINGTKSHPYIVNLGAVDQYVAEHKTALPATEQSNWHIAKPKVIYVSEKPYLNEAIPDLKERSTTGSLCNQGKACFTSVECFTGQGSNCNCAPVCGPSVGVCLL